MVEHPIPFNGPLVRAIFNDRKTQTRRVLKLTDAGHVKEPRGHRRWHPDDPNALLACPYGQPGDSLWVREAWAPRTLGAWSNMDRHMKPLYRESADRPEWKNIWKPAITMPRWASRLLLRITDIRLERLQTISEADARAEGTQEPRLSTLGGALAQAAWSERQVFERLWRKLHGPDTWTANPRVWVISFERMPNDWSQPH
jgi:hypothetical protein